MPGRTPWGAREGRGPPGTCSNPQAPRRWHDGRGAWRTALLCWRRSSSFLVTLGTCPQILVSPSDCPPFPDRPPSLLSLALQSDESCWFRGFP